MYTKAFSLIEIIFTIAIISILAIVAIPKLQNTLTKADIIKIKGDITLIRDGLIKYKNKQILANDTTSLVSLEEDDSLLFGKILKYPIIASNFHHTRSWEKISNNSYKVWLTTDQFLEFSYDSTNYTFDCDKNNQLCEEYNQ